MNWLMPLYIATSIFGVGITIIDLFGIFGESEDDSFGGHHS